MERKYYLRGLGLGIIITAIIMGFAVKGKPAMTDEEIMQRAKELGMIENTMLAEPVQETAQEEATPADTDTAEASDEKAVNTETAKPLDTDAKTDTAKTTDKETESDTTKTSVTDAKTDTAKPSDAEMKADTAKTSDTEGKTDTAKASDSEVKTDTAKPTDAEAKTDTTEQADTETNTDVAKPSATGAQDITIVNGDSSVSVAAKLEQAGLISSASSYDSYLCSNGYDKKIRPGNYSIPADAGDEEIARIITGAQP